MEILSQQIGLHKQDIDTPALVIELPVMEQNIAKMADFAKRRGIDLRPYIKTHKSPVLAHKQLEAGAVGIGCGKLGEAEVMAGAGVRDILVGNQIVGPAKIARLMNLARSTDIMVAVDDYHNVDDLSTAAQAKGVRVRILVEVDLGTHRCGVKPDESAILLARHVDAAPGLDFRGFMGYEAHLQHIADPEHRAARVKEDVGLLVDVAKMAESAGLNVEIVSAGGTVTYKEAGELPGITEIQPGTYIFMDNYYHPRVSNFERALTVLATVVSHPEEDRVVVDAGSKTLSQELGMPGVKDLPGASFVGMYEEHGLIKFEGPVPKLKVGDRLEIFPSHVCTTVNLHDRYYAMKDDRVEEVWEIQARGKVT